MIFLINSFEDYLIKKEIDNLVKKHQIDEFSINNLSMLNNDLNMIIDDFQTYSMFDDKKMVVVDDCILFSSKKTEIDPKPLEEYLNNINKSTIVVFILKDKLDERKKIVKKIREIGTIISDDNNIDITLLVKEMFENYKIDNDSVKLLIDRVGTNLNYLEQEIIKIKLYKDDDLIISSEDIINLTSKNSESDIFTLIDQIINKDKKNAIITYKELIKNNEEPIAIIISLANKLRMVYQTKELLKRGYTEKDIATILKVKPGYLFYMRKTVNAYESGIIIDLLEKLADLDYNIKSGKQDKIQAFELFILEM